MRFLLLLSVLAVGIRASDLTICVVTARGEQNHLPDLIESLKNEGASFMLVDTDNSTGKQGLGQDCMPGLIPCPMQKQGVDLVRGLSLCAEESKSKWIALVDYDMKACKGSVRAMESVLSKLRLVKTARFATSSRAVVFTQGNVQRYYDHVMAHVHEIPRDGLLNYSWVDGIDYTHIESLFSHAKDEMCGSSLH